jgi:hypothetical protein
MEKHCKVDFTLMQMNEAINDIMDDISLQSSKWIHTNTVPPCKAPCGKEVKPADTVDCKHAALAKHRPPMLTNFKRIFNETLSPKATETGTGP